MGTSMRAKGIMSAIKNYLMQDLIHNNHFFMELSDWASKRIYYEIYWGTQLYPRVHSYAGFDRFRTIKSRLIEFVVKIENLKYFCDIDVQHTEDCKMRLDELFRYKMDGFIEEYKKGWETFENVVKRETYKAKYMRKETEAWTT
jgi:hypothetical protein